MLTADDRSGIDSVRAALRDAILSGDADAYAACFTSDAFVMHQDSPYVQGVEAIKEHTEQIFNAVTSPMLKISRDGRRIAWVGNGRGGSDARPA